MMSDRIPIIDLAAEADGGAAAVAAACRRWGFFQVVNHGVLSVLVERMWGEAHRLFALPMADKRALLRSRDNPRGYYDRELTKNARDLKEVFDFHLDPFPDLPSEDPRNHLPVDGHNQWPAALPGFKTTMTDYYRACEGLGHRLLAMFCLGVGAPADRLSAPFGPGHTSFVRLNHYPLDDPLEADQAAAATALGDMALHHHSDAGVLTILLQDAVGGLQCYAEDAWRDVPPVPGALVVNVGDMMQLWSNDAYPAALHRVRPIAGERARLSVPFFFNPTYDTDCAPLAEATAGGRPHYRSVNWGTFRQRRADGDYADYGQEVQLADYRLG